MGLQRKKADASGAPFAMGSGASMTALPNGAAMLRLKGNGKAMNSTTMLSFQDALAKALLTQPRIAGTGPVNQMLNN